MPIDTITPSLIESLPHTQFKDVCSETAPSILLSLHLGQSSLHLPTWICLIETLKNNLNRYYNIAFMPMPWYLSLSINYRTEWEGRRYGNIVPPRSMRRALDIQNTEFRQQRNQWLSERDIPRNRSVSIEKMIDTIEGSDISALNDNAFFRHQLFRLVGMAEFVFINRKVRSQFFVPRFQEHLGIDLLVHSRNSFFDIITESEDELNSHEEKFVEETQRLYDALNQIRHYPRHRQPDYARDSRMTLQASVIRTITQVDLHELNDRYLEITQRDHDPLHVDVRPEITTTNFWSDVPQPRVEKNSLEVYRNIVSNMCDDVNQYFENLDYIEAIGRLYEIENVATLSRLEICNIIKRKQSSVRAICSNIIDAFSQDLVQNSIPLPFLIKLSDGNCVNVLDMSTSSFVSDRNPFSNTRLTQADQDLIDKRLEDLRDTLHLSL